MNSPDRLTLHQMRFFGHHGVFAAERRRGQYFAVTVSVELPLAEVGRSDNLAHGLDYCAIQEVVRAVLEGPPRKLIEALAEAVAAELLAAFPQLTAVEVEVLKPTPPVNFAFAGVSVRLRRERQP
jgi:dihydroneopterin aldolase